MSPSAPRDGTLLLERMAKWKLMTDAASFSASEIIQILMYPTKLAKWAKEEGINASMLYNTINGNGTSRPVVEALAQRLNVPPAAVQQLIERPPTTTRLRVPEVPPEGFEVKEDEDDLELTLGL